MNEPVHQVPMVCGNCGRVYHVRSTRDLINSKACGRKCADAMRPKMRPVPIADRFWQRVRIADPDRCWEWTGTRRDGRYGCVRGEAGQNIQAHRAAYGLAIGPIPPRMYVCHTCDNPLCCNPAHLFLGTPRDNSRDMAAKGRSPFSADPKIVRRGELVPSAVLNARAVREIRTRLARGESQKALAIAFDVSRSTVNLIASRRTWKHVA